MATATTSASQIASAAGISSSNMGLNGTNTRNLANRGGQISYGNCRWGINIPAWQGFNGPAETFYATNSDINYSGYHTYPLGWEGVQNYGQNWVQYILFANGTGVIRESNNQSGDTDVATWTWLTAGSAGNFTARFDLSSGSLWASSPTGTDLALSTVRSWAILAESTWDGVSWDPNPGTAFMSGTLTIKDSGGNTLISRSLSLNATAQMQPL